MKKSAKKPTNKDFQRQIGEIGNGLAFIFQENKEIKSHLGGLESLVMYLAEFRGEKEEFEKFLEAKIEEEKEKAKEVTKSDK
jgi:hypothetical protein